LSLVNLQAERIYGGKQIKARKHWIRSRRA